MLGCGYQIGDRKKQRRREINQKQYILFLSKKIKKKKIYLEQFPSFVN